jgi:hypothetical protein
MSTDQLSNTPESEMTRYDRSELKEICRQYSIDTIYSFGNRATELKMFVTGAGDIDRSKAVDFDVTVKIPPQKSLSVREKSQLTIAVSTHKARSCCHQRSGPVFSGKYNPGRKDFLPR